MVQSKIFPTISPFFRFHAESKIIIFGWVDDERTKRAYGNKHDLKKVSYNAAENDNDGDISGCGS
nr:type II toxin-antitoxin system YhaV family toxin [Photorhabdus akhurstii]